MQGEEDVFNAADTGWEEEGKSVASTTYFGLGGKFNPLGNHPGALLQGRQVPSQAPFHAGVKNNQGGSAA
jgi:hypothetical protein